MMSDAYLEAAFKSVGGMGRPLVLTHDPAAEARAAEIVAKWGAVRYRGPNGLNVDSEFFTHMSSVLTRPLACAPARLRTADAFYSIYTRPHLMHTRVIYVP